MVQQACFQGVFPSTISPLKYFHYPVVELGEKRPKEGQAQDPGPLIMIPGLTKPRGSLSCQNLGSLAGPGSDLFQISLGRRGFGLRSAVPRLMSASGPAPTSADFAESMLTSLCQRPCYTLRHPSQSSALASLSDPPLTFISFCFPCLGSATVSLFLLLLSPALYLLSLLPPHPPLSIFFSVSLKSSESLVRVLLV